jgi:hypothetical protein
MHDGAIVASAITVIVNNARLLLRLDAIEPDLNNPICLSVAWRSGPGGILRTEAKRDAIRSKSSLIAAPFVSGLFRIPEVLFIECLVSLVHHAKCTRPPLGDR